MRYLIFNCLLVVFLVSCSTTKKASVYDRINLHNIPQKQVYQDPGASISSYKTFSVLPFSETGKDLPINKIAEKQLLFFVRNLFEGRGYKFVEFEDNPDFVLALYADAPYKKTYVPPSVAILPTWEPGTTSTTETTSNGSAFIDIYGDYDLSAYGHYNSSSTETTTSSGNVSFQPYTVPGKTVGYYYPSVSIWVHNYETAELIWEGKSVGVSSEPDVRISSQVIFRNLVNEFPEPKQSSNDNPKGVVGVWLGMYTLDGNNYYPTVLGVQENFPAQEAGIIQGDVILRVNDMNTKNVLTKKVIEKIAGPTGEAVTLEIWREGTEKNKVIKLKRARLNQ